MRHALQGVDVGDGRILLKLDGDKARLEQPEAHAGQGLITATGTRVGRCRLRACSSRPTGCRSWAAPTSAWWPAAGPAQPHAREPAAKGPAAADQGRFDFSRADAPSLADDVVVQRGPVVTAERATRRAPRVPPRSISTSILATPSTCSAASGPSCAAKLHLGQRDNKLALTGKIQTHGGQYLAYGRGSTSSKANCFHRPLRQPALDVIATRPNTDTRVGVRITGTALAPRVALFSEPELSGTEKLSWLLLGRAPTASAAPTRPCCNAPPSPCSPVKAALAARCAASASTSSPSPAPTTTPAPPSSASAASSQRWYVGYERSLNATTGSWQLIYRIAQRFQCARRAGTTTRWI